MRETVACYGGDVGMRCTSSTGAAMTVTQIDLDDYALAEAMRLSGARSKKETVNLALREYAARHRRIAASPHSITTPPLPKPGTTRVAGNALGQQDSRCVMRYLADSS